MPYKQLSAFALRQMWPPAWGTFGTAVLSLDTTITADDGVEYPATANAGKSLKNLGFHWQASITVTSGRAAVSAFTDLLPTTDTATVANTARYYLDIYSAKGVRVVRLTPGGFRLDSNISNVFQWSEWVAANEFQADTSLQQLFIGDYPTVNALINSKLYAPATVTSLGLGQPDVPPVDPAHPIWVGVNSPLLTPPTPAPSLSLIDITSATYAARGDAVIASDAAIGAGSPSLASASLVAGLTGKTVLVRGAGAAGADLVTTIMVSGAGTATLATPATTPVSGAAAVWGTENTAKVQAALDAAYAGRVSFVYAPPGTFLFTGNLNVPQGVALIGSWQAAPMHKTAGLGPEGATRQAYQDGTCFLVTAGRGTGVSAGQVGALETSGLYGTSFITLKHNATLKGICFFYPFQLRSSATPDRYPFTVAMREDGPTVQCCEFVNSYSMIDARFNERHLIENIRAQPLACGIFVDKIYDVGRIRDVQFLPYWAYYFNGSGDPADQWSRNNSRMMVFGRTDWEHVQDIFIYGGSVGFDFVSTPTDTYLGQSWQGGNCNGTFVNIGADDFDIPVFVRDANYWGVKITNGEFTSVSFAGDVRPNLTHVKIAETNTGLLQMVNCAFWGNSINNVLAYCAGGVEQTYSRLVMQACTFYNWDVNLTGQLSVEVVGPTNTPSFKVSIQNCHWTKGGDHVRFQNYVKGIIANNIVDSDAFIFLNTSPSTVVSVNNITGL